MVGKTKTDKGLASSRPSSSWLSEALWGYPMVAMLLAAHWVLAVSAASQKCASFDEVAHVMSGYAYWKYADYRLDDSGGVLSCRIMALPLMAGEYRFPSRNDPTWRPLNLFGIGQRFFYEMGNDPEVILFRARCMIALCSLALCGLVYFWARRLFGNKGGIISLAAYSLCPPMLANGALGTLDTPAAAFFLLTVTCFWLTTETLTPLRVLVCGAAAGAALTSKMSGMLVLPILVLLGAIRVIHSRPWAVRLRKTKTEIAGRWKIAATVFVVGVLIAVVLGGTIWTIYGFRYAACSADGPADNPYENMWKTLYESPTMITAIAQFLQIHHVLPEAYLYGFFSIFGMVNQGSMGFLNGEYSGTGFRMFFPYAFLVKTPLVAFALALLAAVAAAIKWRSAKREGIGIWKSILHSGYSTAPLLVMLAVCWSFSIPSVFNIGHRHILPTYGPFLALAGGAAWWLQRQFRYVRFAVAAMLLLLAVEAVWVYPNYLAYFNQIVGGSSNGYKHLVDSSLDWGQDVPALKKWLVRNNLGDRSKGVYLAYFGYGSPTYYGIKAVRLPGFHDADVAATRSLLPDLSGGVYCVSASILQGVYTIPPAPWVEDFEKDYQALKGFWSQFNANSPADRQDIMRRQGQSIIANCHFLDGYRFSRLCAYLRHRQADDLIEYTILVYRLTDSEVHQALEGPPAELLPTSANPFIMTETLEDRQ